MFIELNGWITREIQNGGAEVAKEEQEWFKGVETRHNDGNESGGREFVFMYNQAWKIR